MGRCIFFQYIVVIVASLVVVVLIIIGDVLSHKLQTSSENEIILTRPRQVSVSTKYVTADLDYSNSGTLSITVAVEDGCCPAICLCSPTPHKPAAG